MARSGVQGKRFAVLGGAGAMGRATVYHLARSAERVLLLDADLDAARRVARRYGGRNVDVGTADARDPQALAGLLEGTAVLVNAGPYPFNLLVMQAALLARCH